MQSEASTQLIKRITITYGIMLFLLVCQPSTFQKKNTYNILLAKDPSENIGLYWYLFCEMFADRIPFFRYVILIMQFAMCIFIS